MLEIIKNVTSLGEMQQKLDVVYQNHTNLSFYSPAYVLASFEYVLTSDKRNSLFFVVNKIQNEITHYMPWYIDANKTLRFIFDKHTDYCSCIGPEMNFSMLKDLAKLIITNPEIKRVDFENLLPNDALLNSFKHFLGLGSVISCYNNHSFISSSASKDFFHHLKSKEKSELKRVHNKNKNYNFEVFDGKEVFPEKQIRVLRDLMIANKSRNTTFFDDEFLSFSKLLYDAGELEIFSKWDKEHLVSSSMVLKNNTGNYRMVWIDLYADIQFVNLSAYVDYIHHLEQYSPIVFSFGRGSYDYKAKNFQPQIQNLYNLRYSKSKFDFFFTNYYLLKYFLKRIIKK